MENKAAQRYLAQVRRALACGRADKDQLLDRFKELLDTFQQENPEAEYERFVEAFGEPEACAGELLSGLRKSEKEDAGGNRFAHHWGILAASVVGVMVLSAFWYNQCKKSKAFGKNVTVVIYHPR